MCINYTVVFNTREGAKVLVSMNGRLLQKMGKIICMHDNSTGSLSSVKTYDKRQRKARNQIKINKIPV